MITTIKQQTNLMNKNKKNNNNNNNKTAFLIRPNKITLNKLEKLKTKKNAILPFYPFEVLLLLLIN